MDRGAWWTTLAPCEESYDQSRQFFKNRDIALQTKVFVVNANSQDREAG